MRAGYADRYPHQLSGGQRQRVGIARALAVEPEVIVLDEPLSSLDVSVQSGIMNLLTGLRDELDVAYVFISHDLGMVRHISDRIAVMYLGRVVEHGPWDSVSDRPLHPYTLALQQAVPIADPEIEATREVDTLPGEVPDPANPPAGCPFHTRCSLVEDVCRITRPELLKLEPDHDVSCHVPPAGSADPFVSCPRLAHFGGYRRRRATAHASESRVVLPSAVDAAVGFSTHSGWAVAITARVDVEGHLRVVDRRRVALIDDDLPRQAYHAAAGLPAAEARATVARSMPRSSRAGGDGTHRAALIGR